MYFNFNIIFKYNFIHYNKILKNRIITFYMEKYYSILGLEPNATLEEVKKSYKKLALQ